MINRKLYDLIYNSKNDVFLRNGFISSGDCHCITFQHYINSSIAIKGSFKGAIFDAKFNSCEQLRIQFDKKKDFAMLIYLTLMFIMSKKFGSKGNLRCKYLEEYPKEENQIDSRRITVTLQDAIRNSVWGNMQPNYIRGEELINTQDTRMERVESELTRLQEAVRIFSESLNEEFRRRYEALNEREN